MEGSIFSFIASLIAGGTLGTNSLIAIVILMLCVLSYYIFRPMFNKLNSMATKEELEELIQAKKDIDHGYVQDLESKLDNLIEIMDEIEKLDSRNNREIQELRRDIETIKQILNQIQGHMLFSRNDFGNKELR